jgi:hypothetical protein
MESPERSSNLAQLHDLLEHAAEKLVAKKVMAGLDGFVDSIVQVVNYKTEGSEPEFFQTIEAFGNYIVSKKGSGFSLESEERFQKLGGNMPIMANAMGYLGIQVDCIGAFGVPLTVPVFSEMHSNCKLYSFTNPGLTTAIEFTDGKMMLAQMTDLNHADWFTIKQALSLEKIVAVFQESEMLCLVNWSELDHSNEIWAGILQEVVLPEKQASIKKQFFFDLSDCSKRSEAAITTALSLMKEFNRYGGVTLSLNRNEAGILYKTCFKEIADNDWKANGERLFEQLTIDTLIIHSAKSSMAWDQEGFYVSEPVFIANPILSTGAGDNFNAGYCIGRLLGGSTGASIELANIVSNLYMSTGQSPDMNRVKAYISQFKDAP